MMSTQIEPQHGHRTRPLHELILEHVEAMTTYWTTERGFGFVKLSYASIDRLREHLKDHGQIPGVPKSEIDRAVGSGIFVHGRAVTHLGRPLEPGEAIAGDLWKRQHRLEIRNIRPAWQS